MKQQNTLGFYNTQLNLIELLRDCKENTPFYSRECGQVVFSHIEDNSIFVYADNGDARSYDSKGYDVNADPTAEPMFFPSKDVQDWSFYKVKYIKVNNQAETVKAIEYFEHEGYIKSLYTTYLLAGGVVYIDAITHEINTHSINYRPYCYEYILSTGTELKLEEKEEEPEFKVGDVVICGAKYMVASEHPTHRLYELDPRLIQRYFDSDAFGEHAHLATPEEITKWNEKMLEPNHLHYSKSKRKIIHWFLPFDRIVERCKDDDEVGEWTAGMFSHYDKENPYYPYRTLCGFANECLPYNDKTAKLIGTTDDYEEE